MSSIIVNSSIITPPKVIVFDVDETLGNFIQFAIFCNAIEEYCNKPDITYRYFNELMELYPEILRPSIIRILEYIRRKKSAGVCSKVMIFTNNRGPPKWVEHIRDYLEKKLTQTHTTTNVPPLFDRIIGGFKSKSAALHNPNERTTGEKTVSEFLRISRLPQDIEICFLDDVLHPKMVDNKVYYIKLQGYHSYIPFEQYIARFISSTIFDQFAKNVTVTANTSYQIQKQIAAIEINNLVIKYAKIMNYDAKQHITHTNPREIDEIISKYILYHLEQFFKDRPKLNVLRYNNKHKTRKSINYSSSLKRVFLVNKAEALKNKRGKSMKKK